MTNLQLARYLTRVICRMALLIRRGWCVDEREFVSQERAFLSELDALGFCEAVDPKTLEICKLKAGHETHHYSGTMAWR